MTNPPYVPLTSNDCISPSLFIDSQAPLEELHASAAYRFLSVTQLMETLSSRDLENADPIDLRQIASAARILLRDGCDLMDVIGRRLRN